MSLLRLTVAAVSALMAVPVLSAGNSTPSESPLRPVTLQLKWKHQFQFAGYYVARERGLYREAGLDVTIREHSDDAGVEAVASGEIEFGIAMSDLVVYRARGLPVVALASIFQHSPLVLLVRGDLGIDNLHSLDGRNVMIEPHAAELLAYLEFERMPITRLTVHPHTYDAGSLLDGTVDAMSAYLTDEPFELRAAGIPYSLFSPRSGGIDFYGDTLFTSQRMIDSQPDVVEAFRAASIAGWRWALDHPEETVDLILERYSDRHSRAHLLFEAEQTGRLVLHDVVEIGYMNPGRWKHIAEVYAELGSVPRNLDLDGFLYDASPSPDLGRLYGIVALFLGIGTIIALVALRYYRLSTQLHREIAEREVVQSNLARREREYDVLLSNLPGMAFRCQNQRDWSMEFASSGCQPLTGYAPERLTGANRLAYAEIIHPDDRERVWRDVQSAVAENRPFQSTYRIVRADGAIRWVWGQGRMTDGPTGEPGIEGFITDVSDYVEADQARDSLIGELQTALDEITTLRGIIPICSGCKRIRDDRGYWNQIESYISAHSDADFSHGICPECEESLYGQTTESSDSD